MLEVVPAFITGRSTARAESIRVQSRRFHYKFRRKVVKLAYEDDRLADLLQSSPAAAFDIATRDPDDPVRIEATRLVMEGQSLTVVARALQQPLWLRRLPPEAFVEPLDHGFSQHWHNAAFAARILNAAPLEAERTGRWLRAVIQAEHVGGPAFAQWIASQRLFTTRRPPPVQLLPLGMYAWYSTQSGLPGGQIIPQQWNDKISLGRASSLTREWFVRALQDFCLDPDMFKDVWNRSRIVGKFEIVPLITASSLHDEAAMIHNCLKRYVSNVAQGVSHIYSVRLGGVRIADFEVRMSTATGQPWIAQICGPRNNRAAPEAQDAASAWLMLQLRDAGPMPKVTPPRYSEVLFQRDIWGPYERARCSDIGTRFNQKAPSAATVLNELSALALLERS